VHVATTGITKSVIRVKVTVVYVFVPEALAGSVTVLNWVVIKVVTEVVVKADT